MYLSFGQTPYGLIVSVVPSELPPMDDRSLCTNRFSVFIISLGIHVHQMFKYIKFAIIVPYYLA